MVARESPNASIIEAANPVFTLKAVHTCPAGVALAVIAGIAFTTVVIGAARAPNIAREVRVIT